MFSQKGWNRAHRPDGGILLENVVEVCGISPGVMFYFLSSWSSEIGKDGEGIDLLRKIFHRRDFYFLFIRILKFFHTRDKNKTKTHCKEHQANPVIA